MSKRSIEEDTATMEAVNAKKKCRGVIPSTIADVLEDLKGLKTPGAPSVGGKADVPALPGLTVNGVGMLSLPLVSGVVVKQLAAVATKSPFGKGSDTLVDEAVRKSWQIEPAQVSFGNPSFGEAIQNLAKSAARDLGVPENISVEAILYKLLLYEPGGFFKKHRDTEKEDGMFATLVVQLPSVYTGGNLKVSHGEDMTKDYAMGTDNGTAPYCCHFVAHYADCEHEVDAVESGYRLALVYSLCHKEKDAGSQVPTTEMATGPAKKLHNTLELLPAGKLLMFFPLRHCYTTVSLARYGLQALKGRDGAILRSFQLNGTWKFRIFRLARKFKEYATEHYLDDFDKSEEEHRRIHTSEFNLGHASFEEVYWTEGTEDRLSDSWLGHTDLYISCDSGGRVLASSDDIADTWKRTDQIETEYTGNDGYRERETKYQCYTVMVYKANAELDFVMEYDISEAIEVISNAGKKSADVDRLFRVLRSLPSRVPKSRHSSEDKCDDAEKALALLGEPTDGEFLEEEWVKNLTSCINLIVFEKMNSIGMFWTKLGKIVAKCSEAKNAEVLVNHFQSLLRKPVKEIEEATAKAYMIALVSTNAPNTAVDTMIETLVGAIDVEKSEISRSTRVPDVVTSMMELDITPSIYPLVRKLFPLWKIKMNESHAYRLIPVIGCKMDAKTRNQWVDEIVPPAVDGRFLKYYTRDLKRDPALVHLVFERGTDDHVGKLSSIVNDTKAVDLRWLLPMLWKDYTGPTQSQAWKPLMELLVDAAVKETVERLLTPRRLFPNYSKYSKFEDHSDLVHFLFMNGTDEDIIKLLEIVDSEAGKANIVREGLLKLYRDYEGAIKGKHAWDVVIQRLEK